MKTQDLGFIGLGQMGGPMARNLAAAGFTLHVFDLVPERIDACVEVGAVAADDVASVVTQSQIVFTSLPHSPVFVEVAERQMLPHACERQIFVDLSTVNVEETRRLASLFSECGASLLDVPVSGGHVGAEAGTLRMFGAGDRDVFASVKGLLEVMGDPDHIVYCGESGMGQVVKGVNQLGMGLAAAASLEAVAFGLLAGADPQAIVDGVGGDTGWRHRVVQTVQAVLAHRAETIGIKFGQLEGFLDSAERCGFALPISRALYEFCKDGERCVMEANRLSPSFWRELSKDRHQEL